MPLCECRTWRIDSAVGSRIEREAVRHARSVNVEAVRPTGIVYPDDLCLGGHWKILWCEGVRQYECEPVIGNGRSIAPISCDGAGIVDPE
jgi:hypothetical protein